ncbi:methyltransferase domain-containing protein [Streptomyces sp. NPDC050988]|uniref:methyltransferase domain-containing protein n=1 Tax=Streptomyces sp. NPDC050988 TaxID=3365637 RepID=UPI0037A50D03
MIDPPLTYWEPLWASGRRYRQITGTEEQLLARHLGPGHGRPALDVGCGDGSLSRHLHDRLGYRTTGIDCAPSAITLAAADAGPGTDQLRFQVMDFATDDLSELPEPAFAVITCRLVYRFISDKGAFVDRVRQLLAPGGTFWVVTELAERRADNDRRKSLGITASDVELLTSCWSTVQAVDLDRLACFALRRDTAPRSENTLLSSEETNRTAWTAYGRHHIDRATKIPDAPRICWGFWPIGPGAEVLGDLSGKRVLDLGSGMGKYAAHLVREHAAVVDAVEASPTQHERALARYGALPGLNLIHADAVEHLERAEPYDVIYSIHGVGYIDPHRLLAALRTALKPGGLLIFSVLHTDSEGRGPSPTVAARPGVLPLAGGDPLSVQMWVLSPTLWEDLLVDNGLLVDAVEVLDAPDDGNPVSVRLFRARRSLKQ